MWQKAKVELVLKGAISVVTIRKGTMLSILFLSSDKEQDGVKITAKEDNTELILVRTLPMIISVKWLLMTCNEGYW